MTTPGATRLEVVSFPVEGMTCASCVNRITRFLSRVEGVETASESKACAEIGFTHAQGFAIGRPRPVDQI